MMPSNDARIDAEKKPALDLNTSVSSEVSSGIGGELPSIDRAKIVRALDTVNKISQDFVQRRETDTADLRTLLTLGEYARTSQVFGTLISLVKVMIETGEKGSGHRFFDSNSPEQFPKNAPPAYQVAQLLSQFQYDPQNGHLEQGKSKIWEMCLSNVSEVAKDAGRVFARKFASDRAFAELIEHHLSPVDSTRLMKSTPAEQLKALEILCAVPNWSEVCPTLLPLVIEQALSSPSNIIAGRAREALLPQSGERGRVPAEAFVEMLSRGDWRQIAPRAQELFCEQSRSNNPYASNGRDRVGALLREATNLESPVKLQALQLLGGLGGHSNHSHIISVTLSKHLETLTAEDSAVRTATQRTINSARYDSPTGLTNGYLALAATVATTVAVSGAAVLSGWGVLVAGFGLILGGAIGANIKDGWIDESKRLASYVDAGTPLCDRIR